MTEMTDVEFLNEMERRAKAGVHVFMSSEEETRLQYLSVERFTSTIYRKNNNYPLWGYAAFPSDVLRAVRSAQRELANDIKKVLVQ